MRFRIHPTLSTSVFALLLSCSFLLSACGNRGPLTLPPKDISAQPAGVKTTPADHSKTATPGKP
jgi:predicted small lipoprotein YifL